MLENLYFQQDTEYIAAMKLKEDRDKREIMTSGEDWSERENMIAKFDVVKATKARQVQRIIIGCQKWQLWEGNIWSGNSIT